MLGRSQNQSNSFSFLESVLIHLVDVVDNVYTSDAMFFHARLKINSLSL